jgi:catechol 2,3-dioxygenase-like lactoylglutathione lyase family enzyme
MTVSDLARSEDFYCRVLTFQKVSDVELVGREYDALYGTPNVHVHAVEMRLGDESIELIQFQGLHGKPVPADARSNDLSFQHVAIIVSDMDAAYGVLRRNHVEHVSSYPQILPSWNVNAAGLKAFYFKDPDGHVLEILQFPPGKGDPKWQNSSGKLFLGVDHTAIAVSSTERSLDFYKKLLGMGIAGQSENYGPEQEHLNNVFGAHLEITSLRSPQGIGVEFLEYVAPRDGKRAIGDERASDIAHHQTVIAVDNLDALNRELEKLQNSADSLKPISASRLLFGARKAELVHDPDGHTLLLVQP